MRGFPKEAITVLGDAIEAARRALREMDPDDIPSSLRRVVSSSSGRLPPPLARSLITELDRNDWLRAEAVEHLAVEGPSRAFLERSDGWWMPVASGVADERARAARGQVAELEARVEGLQSDVKTLRSKARKARREADARAGEARTELAAGRKRLENALAASRSELASAERRLEAEAAALATARAERDEADRAVRELNRRVRELRRRAAQVASAEHLKESSVPRAGVALARHVDLLAAMAAVPAADAEAGEAVLPAAAAGGDGRAALSIPAGIRPDSGAAIDWLLSCEDDYALVVDGHNVLFQLDASSAITGDARARLVSDLARLRVVAATDPVVVVVFDSHVPGVREPEFRDGVELFYAGADETADELVVEMAGEFAIPVVVVSSDRAVREAAEEVAAIALWAEALAEWLRRT